MKKTPLVMVMLSLFVAASVVQVEAATPPKGMVYVPPGEFIMGANPDQLADIADKVGGMVKYIENATPRRKVNLPGYYIDKYEVTNEQYKQFVDAAKHTPPEYWEGGKIPAGKGKHPVVFVTLDDAKAYAKWAGKRLPSEAEWEKAARGTDGRIFPWGNKYKRKRANTDEARKRGTTPVGAFEKGKSPYGAYDMAGNVWEWTTGNYLPYPGSTCQDEFFGKERYVIRGGSFMDFKNDALSLVRSKFTPATDDENVGFRCVKEAK